MDDRLSEKLTWAFSSGELKTKMYSYSQISREVISQYVDFKNIMQIMCFKESIHWVSGTNQLLIIMQINSVKLNLTCFQAF